VPVSTSSPTLLGLHQPSRRERNDGSFAVSGVLPDKYLFLMSFLPKGTYVESVRLGGDETVDSGLDLSALKSNGTLQVLLNAKGAMLEGTVRER
jgi:hypothetical protein